MRNNLHSDGKHGWLILYNGYFKDLSINDKNQVVGMKRQVINTNNLMTSKEVAEYLGVSLYRVQEYARNGLLKGTKLGANKHTRTDSRRHWRFKREDVESFLARGKQ